MRIYNKKKFMSGICLVALGTVNLMLDLGNHLFDIKSMILIVSLFLLGLAFSFTVSMFSELFTYGYYETKN